MPGLTDGTESWNPDACLTHGSGTFCCPPAARAVAAAAAAAIRLRSLFSWPVWGVLLPAVTGLACTYMSAWWCVLKFVQYRTACAAVSW